MPSQFSQEVQGSQSFTGTQSQERLARALPGAPKLLVFFALLIGSVLDLKTRQPQGLGLFVPILLLFLAFVSLNGFFTLQPNERVC